MGEKTIFRIVKSLVVVLLLLFQGCTSLYPEIHRLSEIESSSVLLVGKVILIPRLREGEQQIHIRAVDVMGMADKLRGRVLLFLSKENREPDQTSDVLNPKLDETFYFGIPKE